MQDRSVKAPPHSLRHIVAGIEWNPVGNSQTLLGTRSDIQLDKAQARSLLLGLKSNVTLIQGPPGIFCLIILEFS
jgi:hypothetical protein